MLRSLFSLFSFPPYFRRRSPFFFRPWQKHHIIKGGLLNRQQPQILNSPTCGTRPPQKIKPKLRVRAEVARKSGRKEGRRRRRKEEERRGHSSPRRCRAPEESSRSAFVCCPISRHRHRRHGFNCHHHKEQQQQPVSPTSDFLWRDLRPGRWMSLKPGASWGVAGLR